MVVVATVEVVVGATVAFTELAIGSRLVAGDRNCRVVVAVSVAMAIVVVVGIVPEAKKVVAASAAAASELLHFVAAQAATI